MIFNILLRKRAVPNPLRRLVGLLASNHQCLLKDCCNTSQVHLNFNCIIEDIIECEKKQELFF